MALVATPRRALADKQPTYSIPSILAVDIMSPTPQQRKRQHQQVQMLGISQSQSQPRASTSGSRVASVKRARDEETEAAAAAKRCRTQRIDATTPTVVKQRARPAVTPPAIMVTAPPPESVKETKRKAKHSRAERIEREKEILTFKDRYTRVFPNFRFYFHGLDSGLKNALSSKVLSLGAKVEDFFSASITHVISNRARPDPSEADRIINNKENDATAASGSGLLPAASIKSTSSRPGAGNSLRSPIKLRSAGKLIADMETPSYDPVIVKTLQLGMKLWESNKLESILTRLLSSPSTSHAPLARTIPNVKNASQATSKSGLTLSHLLQAEKQSGVTHERDPNAKRPDYDYFPKNSYFLMVQDCDEAFAPVAIKDYGRWKRGDKPGWPVLNLDGLGYSSRNRAPVFGWKPDIDRKESMGKTVDSKAVRKQPNLRKTASMHNLGRKKASLGGLGGDSAAADRSPLTRDLLKPIPDQSVDHGKSSGGGASRPSVPSFASFASGASGLPSQAGGYIAASGNSAMITSNLNSMTSAAGLLRPDPTTGGALGKRLYHQVLTNRAFGKPAATTNDKEDVVQDEVSMPPPIRPHVIKKSKSTNTLRLPPREETKKPGYCENCRCKFEDFTKHIRSTRHTKFANNIINFIELDDALTRVRRRTINERRLLEAIVALSSSSDSETSESEAESEDATDNDHAIPLDDRMEWSDESDTALNDHVTSNDINEVDDYDELALKHGHSDRRSYGYDSDSDDETPDMEIGEDVEDLEDF